MKSLLAFLLFFAVLPQLEAGTPERARQLMRAYDSAYAQWLEELRNAADNDQINALLQRQPDTLKAGRLVWEEIQTNLTEAWILEPASWLLTNAAEFAVAPLPGVSRPDGADSPAAIIRNTVWDHHLRSPRVGPYCVALTYVEDPRAMRLLEMIEKTNQDPGVKGAAALAQAILHRRLGQDGTVMTVRQEKLRTAIVAPDLTVGNTTTQEIARDEVFRMTRLNVGTLAPDFRGIEVNQNTSSLRDHLGKVTILLFWHSRMPSAEETLELFQKYQDKFDPKDVAIVGVNLDNPLTLRQLIADGTVTWKNYTDSTQTISKLYRIENWPFVYLLDHEHKIRYSGAPGAFVEITAQELAREASAQRDSPTTPPTE